MCGSIASDEGRHEIAYQRIVDKLYELDPDGSVVAFADMMRKQIVMPAHLMDDGVHGEKNVGRNLFADFSSVAERVGVYTAFDYADIMEFLIKKWRVGERSHQSGDAAAAQEYLMKMPDRVRRLAERAAARKSKVKPVQVQFSWIFDRSLNV
jgi:acyl-[acyl-carrier-protein] desaturase